MENSIFFMWRVFRDILGIFRMDFLVLLDFSVIEETTRSGTSLPLSSQVFHFDELKLI